MENKQETIAIASDHAGYAMKSFVKQFLSTAGYQVLDLGTHSEESCDYSDYGHALAEAVERGEVKRGVGICGSGEGMAMTLNKHQGIRAALVWDAEIARMTRLHNDANVLVLPGRYIDTATAETCLQAFLTTSFEGGRHVRRLEKMPLQATKKP